MRLQLSDGTMIDFSMLNATSVSSSRRQENAPSKRQVKQLGGARRRSNSRLSSYVTSQGRLTGSKDITKASYQDMEIDPETGEYVKTVPVLTAIVINPLKRTFTLDLGGSTPSPYRGGKGL